MTENYLAKLFSHSLTPGPQQNNYLNEIINKLIELRAAKTVIEHHDLSDEWRKMTAKARMEVISWIEEEGEGEGEGQVVDKTESDSSSKLA